MEKKNNFVCFDGMLLWLKVLDLYSHNPEKTIKNCLQEAGEELNVPKGFVSSMMLKKDSDVIIHIANFFLNITGNVKELSDAIAQRRSLAVC